MFHRGSMTTYCREEIRPGTEEDRWPTGRHRGQTGKVHEGVDSESFRRLQVHCAVRENSSSSRRKGMGEYGWCYSCGSWLRVVTPKTRSYNVSSLSLKVKGKHPTTDESPPSESKNLYMTNGRDTSTDVARVPTHFGGSWDWYFKSRISTSFYYWFFIFVYLCVGV